MKKSWLIDSIVLNYKECLSLVEMTNSSSLELVYHATRDWFNARAFHSKCDRKANIVTIIKINQTMYFELMQVLFGTAQVYG